MEISEFLLVVVQLLSHVQLFATPWTVPHKASLSFTISWSLLKLMSFESVMPSNHLILCRPLSSCLQSFPASEYFPMSQLFASGSQSTAASASASVLPLNLQDWFPSGFPLGLTGWISLQSKRLSRVFSSTTVQKHQFFGTQPSLWSDSHICTWLLEKTTLTIWTFVGKVMSLLFNTLSRFVIAFLPRSKGLLIPWLQSASTVILEPKKIKSVYYPIENSKY